MSKEQARALLGFSFVDFADRVHTISTPVLTELRADLVAEGDNRLTQFGIQAIDEELQARA